MRTALRVLFDQSALSKDRLPKDPEYSFYRNGLPKSITRGNVRDIVDKGSLFTSIFNVVPGTNTYSGFANGIYIVGKKKLSIK